jgi:hypothetical protein
MVITRKQQNGMLHPYSKIADIIRKRGWLSTISGTLLFILKLVRSWWWDWTHNVTTRHKVPVPNLGILGPSAAHAVFYEASDATLLTRLLRGLNIPYSEYVFVDLGAGKGKCLLLAAEFPFKKILGLEISPTLSSLARQNCQTFRSHRLPARTARCFEVLCGDAVEFTFPNVPLVIYLFNPFSAEILSHVLTNLVQSINQCSREIFLIYYNPLHSRVIESSHAFELLLAGTDKWDYRDPKLRYKVFRARTVGNC